MYILSQLTKSYYSSVGVICLSCTVTRTLKKKCTSQVFSKKIIFTSKIYKYLVTFSKYPVFT